MKMGHIYKADIFSAGKEQLVLENGLLRVILVPEVGGRIAEIRMGGIGFLHRTYPKGIRFGNYVEYGGIEECMGGFPGTLWNSSWGYKETEEGVVLSTRSDRVLVRKEISLDDNGSIIRIVYTLANLSHRFSKFTFGIHPEIRISDSIEKSWCHLPAKGGTLSLKYTGPGFKDHILPEEGWVGASCGRHVLAMFFPRGVLDDVEVYFPLVGTHIVLEPLIYGVGISPMKEVRFTCQIYAGEGDWADEREAAEHIRALYAESEKELWASYADIDRSKISEEELREDARKRGVKQRKMRVARFEEFEPVLGLVEMIEDFEGEFEEFKHRHAFEADEHTELQIEGLSGTIEIKPWDRPQICLLSKARPDPLPSKEGNVIRFKGIKGRVLLHVPERLKGIYVKSISSNVLVDGLELSWFFMDGINGKVDIRLRPAKGGIYRVKAVNGYLRFAVPLGSSLRISASRVLGRIICELPLDDIQEGPGTLKGVLNEGDGEADLSIVNGRILISPLI